jgi:hypothetical protein
MVLIPALAIRKSTTPAPGTAASVLIVFIIKSSLSQVNATCGASSRNMKSLRGYYYVATQADVDMDQSKRLSQIARFCLVSISHCANGRQNKHGVCFIRIGIVRHIIAWLSVNEHDGLALRPSAATLFPTMADVFLVSMLRCK